MAPLLRLRPPFELQWAYMTIQETIERRSKSRKRVVMAATLISAEGSQRVRVRDISSCGAQIYADTRITEGHDVCFRTGPVFVAARIAWSRNGVAGLNFYRELTAAEGETAFHAAAPIEGDKR